MNLALKDIRHNIGRFSLTTVGVGMLLMVVMGMGGIYRGLIQDATLLIDRVGADLWVVQRDTRGPLAEVSRLPANLVYRVAVVPGVETSREFVFLTIQREYSPSLDPRATRVIRFGVLGLSWPNDKGDWLPLVAGRPLRQQHFEMVADVSLGMALDDRIQLGRETYTVVGLCKNMMNSSGDGIAFFSSADALAIQFDTPNEGVRLEREARRTRGERSDLGAQQPILLEQAQLPASKLAPIAPPQIGAVLIQVAPGHNIEEVARTISAWRDVSVYSGDDEKDFLLQGMIEKVRRQIGLFRILLTVIAAIIMSLILYTLTLDKLHSIALLKLIGAPFRVILMMILQQALFLGIFGYGIAYAIGSKVFPLFPRRVILTSDDLWQLAGIVLLISIASSMLGIWKALRVQPNEALS